MLSLKGRGSCVNRINGGDPVATGFVEFARLVIDSFLSEIDRELRLKYRDTPPADPTMDWDELWATLQKRP